MFLTVLSAIALAAGGTMTVNSLSAEDVASDVQEPVVEVAPIQQEDQIPGELGW